jgi:Arc-like DNA binding domain
MAREDPHFRLRIPEALLEKVQESAGERKRSATAEIINRLEQSFELERLARDYERAEIQLAERTRTERDLRRQIEVLEERIASLKSAPPVDFTNEAVQQAMVASIEEVMDSVIKDMREQHKLTNGLHLLLKWFSENPEERAVYEALPEGDREEFAREKTHSLWIEHLNDKRGRGPKGRK